MSDDFVIPPTAPDPKNRDAGLVWTPKQYSDTATLDLTDEEIQKSWVIIQETVAKHQPRWVEMIMRDVTLTTERLAGELDKFRDEIVSRLGEEVGLAANVDGMPCLEGKPPIVEIVGHLAGTEMDKYGLDHERKGWEVTRATQRDEDFYGQKGITKKKKAK